MSIQTAQLLRTRIAKVCVAITGSSPAEMLDRAIAAARETPFLEFRLDYLAKPAAALPAIKDFLAANTAVTAIATCRLKANGGRFDASPAAELEVLCQAAESGFQIVDLEVESAEALKPGQLDRLRQTGVGLIVSYHNFKETRDLDAVYARIEPFAPEFVKIVPTAKSLTDNVTLMRFIERISDKTSIIGICMGDAGIISRVLGLRAGSAFTFASASAGEETGPGQIDARTLVETYRIDDVDAATKVYGVAGNPVGKSLSPVMMNTAFRRETVNAVYLALQTSKVADLVELIKQIPIQGVSVTMPHKQEILQYLAHTDPLSEKIGACNTILRAADGKLYGFNTDVAGIVLPLSRRLTLKDAKVLVLGAGGSARAAVFGLRDKGAEVSIFNRTPETAAKLAKQSGAKVVRREALAKMAFDVIINATPVGMSGQKAAQILTADDFAKGLKTRFVFDLVYNPVDTPLIRLARQQGIGVITGVEMFVQQGARQFEIWTGKPAPEEEMLRVVIHALRQGVDGAGTDSVPVMTRPAPEPEPEELEPEEAEPAPAAPPAPKATRPRAIPTPKPVAKPEPASLKAKPAPPVARPKVAKSTAP